MSKQQELQLKNLYETHLGKMKDVRERVKKCFPYGPFLIGHVEPFASQALKLMIIGQQTKTWANEDDVDHQMTAHKNFGNGSGYCRSPFFAVSRKIEDHLKIAPYSCAYANLNRFDANGKRPMGADEQIVSELDFLLVEEIAILQPDVCVLFTGPTFDHRIRKLLPEIQYLGPAHQ